VLGDFAFGRYSAIESVFKRLSGEIYLVRGNHDRRISTRRYLDMGFVAVFDAFDMHCSIGGARVVLTRAPLDSVPAGMWNLHGHTRSKSPHTGPRSLDVGVDAWGYAPADIFTLSWLMSGGKAGGQSGG